MFRRLLNNIRAFFGFAPTDTVGGQAGDNTANLGGGTAAGNAANGGLAASEGEPERAFPALRAPVVGISGGSAQSKSVMAMMRQVRAMGGEPVFLGNHAKRNAAEDITALDALVVMGNDFDIDPASYGATTIDTHTKNESQDPAARARAQYETQLIQQALRHKTPLLGVCGGMQRINVLLGGTLHQHIPDLLGGDESHNQAKADIPPFTPVKFVAVDKTSTLGAIAQHTTGWFLPNGQEPEGMKIFKENSFHHQAVAKLGNGLHASAHYDDGLVGAIEADPNGPLGKQFVLGAQFHPEFGASPLASKITSALVEAGRAHAQALGRSDGPAATVPDAVYGAFTAREQQAAQQQTAQQLMAR